VLWPTYIAYIALWILVLIATGTPTWMGNTLKIVAVYSSPFWRATGLSGASFNAPPLQQIWDNSFTDSKGQEHYALAGFVMGQTCFDYVGKSSEQVRELVLPQLVDIYGEAARTQLKGFMHKNWREEPMTFVENVSSDIIRAPPPTHAFGSPGLRNSLWKGRLIFSGTETEREDGHMEGAVMSGLRAARQVIEALHNAE
jgi:monoamine oxidase